MSIPEEQAGTQETNQAEEQPENRKIVRLFKTIVLNPEQGKEIDSRVVAFRYYNAFNYSLLPRIDEEVALSIGITSANVGEGKTLVASNLAVSLAMAYQRETILVDLNIQHPRLHKIFGTVQAPGLTEALENGSIHVSKTSIDHLFVLSAGALQGKHGWMQNVSQERNDHQNGSSPSVGLEQLAAFRDVIYSLKHEFEFIIVDMPPIHAANFPILFANQLAGLLVVLQVGKTKRVEVGKIFRKISRNHVLGFVVNEFADE